jgi:hypothetical protein
MTCCSRSRRMKDELRKLGVQLSHINDLSGINSWLFPCFAVELNKEIYLMRFKGNNPLNDATRPEPEQKEVRYPRLVNPKITARWRLLQTGKMNRPMKEISSS